MLNCFDIASWLLPLFACSQIRSTLRCRFTAATNPVRDSLGTLDTPKLQHLLFIYENKMSEDSAGSERYHTVAKEDAAPIGEREC